ncbi:uncharacterized protein LOC126614131 [Malus sylvestris]|uniref:uncharacterized protein LOC126614131 n=1 Tax=Malus sylvestris TaxID=3752 RepID=UPI0021AD0E7C|nr:uncharacterized protein LOC126614131 [Malus sylvestris]
MAEDNVSEAESSLAASDSTEVETRAISLALRERSKLGYVNGAIAAPAATSPTYGAWLCKDQLVISWLLNSMERRIAEIFSYSESSMHLWKQVNEMYGNQNNVQHLARLTSMWNELDVYRPHTTDATVLTKRVEEDKIVQLLASLGPEFEDLRSHILMNVELPSFTGVCAIIQREEVRKKVMSQETKDVVSETRVDVSSNNRNEGKIYKGMRPECSYCDTLGHTRDKC